MKSLAPRATLYPLTAAALGLLALALVPMTLLAQPPGPGGGPGGFGAGPGHGARHFGPGPGGDDFAGPGFARFAERLGLTAEQQETIRGISDSFRDTLRTQQQAVGDLHKSLMEQSRADVLDEAAIRQTAQELGLAQADLAITRARMHQEIRQVLTPEQQAQLDEMHQRRQERMQERREGRQQRWDGRPGAPAPGQ